MIYPSAAAYSSISRIRRLIVGLAALGAIAGPASAAMRVEHVVMLMRHGVRPPTKSPAMPVGIAADAWPSWPVAPGELTPHGAEAITLLGKDDRTAFGASIGMAAGCPAAGAVRVRSDSDQRTIATGDAFLAGFAPGCGIANSHSPQGEADPLFAAAGEESRIDPAKADQAVAAALGPGGIGGVEAVERTLLTRLDKILCGEKTFACGVSGEPSRILPAAPDKRPKLAGALDRGSTAAQILLLEYAEGKPMADVGWGRATASDVTALSRLHAVEFALLARPPYLAARNIAPIAKEFLAAVTETAPKLTVIVGHDTNVASLGGLLGLHWRAPGYAEDDPPPGGALIFTILGDGKGKQFVRAEFRAQSLEQLRALKPGADYRVPLAIRRCAPLCPLPQFERLMMMGGTAH